MHLPRRLSARVASLSTAGLVLVLAGCGSPPAAADAQEGPWPPPPTEAGWTRADSAWGELPGERSYGAVSAIYPAPDGRSLWVAERCGANLCVESEVDPVLHFDLDGNRLAAFGAGLMAWPHGMFVEPDGSVWVTDAVGYAPVPDGWGHVIYKFSPEGEVLMTLGERGVAGDAPGLFNKPSDVLVAPDGHIFVADGHDAGGNNRIVKLSPGGEFLMAWGETGTGDGQFRDPHALAMDSRGRLFVGDRGNSRIQLFDQEGTHLETWSQFGRPSGLFIDGNDVLYAADSESNTQRNPGVRRGIYVGNALTGEVTHFIPDPEPDPDEAGTSGAEGVAVDARGRVYGAEVGPRTVRVYDRVEGEQPASFFLTSRGPGNGADLGGLQGADAHCAALADEAGLEEREWRAYLSAAPSDGNPAVHARDRIGAGPWYNTAGVMVARDVEHLHGENGLTKETVLDETGSVVNGRGDDPNRHDILTGSGLDGRLMSGDGDVTCGNWTSSDPSGSAQVGHHDRTGGGQNPTSWNSAHGSRGCGQSDLQGTGGDGLFYCFAADTGAAARD